MRTSTNLVKMESCSANTPPVARLDYVDNVHEFLGGLVSITIRHLHGRRYLLLGFRLPKAKSEK
ncbi:MAG TPA: hypothetical protein VJS44_08275 [Pyrinomonadaceae bacterium]|nr:hypothetical protein [Pyrinomonadaceae bacterium]